MGEAHRAHRDSAATAGERPRRSAAGASGAAARCLSIALALGLVLAAAAGAQPIEQFTAGAGCGPWGIASGPDGNLWLTCGSSNQVKKVRTDGSVENFYTLPQANSYPVGVTTGADGNVWFGEHNVDRVAKITTSGVITQYTLPNAGSGVVGVTRGGDGNVWFSEQQGHRVGKITPSGTITEYTDPDNPGMTPGLLALGPDGNVWVDEGTNDVIAKVTPSGVFTDYTAPSATSIGGIANGEDGYMWFVEDGADKVARIRVSDGHIDEFGPFPGESGFGDIALGPDRRIWVDERANSKLLRLHSSGVLQAVFTVANDAWNGIAGPDGNVWFINGFADAVTRVDTATGFEDFPFACSQSAAGGRNVLPLANGGFWAIGNAGAGPFVEYHAPPALAMSARYPYQNMNLSDFFPPGMVVDGGGNLWFTNAGTPAIEEHAPWPSTDHTTFPLGAQVDGLNGLALGADGNFWFTSTFTSQVGRMTPQGTATLFSTPSDSSGPRWIVAGPDGNLWFNEFDIPKLGKITTAGVATEFSSPFRVGSLTQDGQRLWGASANAAEAELLRATTAGSAAGIVVPDHPSWVSVAPDGVIWYATGYSNPQQIYSWQPSTGAWRAYQPAVAGPPLVIDASALGSVWYAGVRAPANGSGLCDATHPGVFGHLRLDIFADGFESGDVSRWSAHSF
jgi:streptogramin lyase